MLHPGTTNQSGPRKRAAIGANKMKTDYEQGFDAGMEIATELINKELGTDFASLGLILQHLWKVKMGYATINRDQTK